MPGSEKHTGVVKKLSEKGFGFIKMKGRDKDMFFHAQDLEEVKFEDLQEGDQLQFRVGDGRDPGTFRAVEVRRI